MAIPIYQLITCLIERGRSRAMGALGAHNGRKLVPSFWLYSLRRLLGG